jgi:hypothetical protein
MLPLHVYHILAAKVWFQLWEGSAMKTSHKIAIKVGFVMQTFRYVKLFFNKFSYQMNQLKG